MGYRQVPGKAPSLEYRYYICSKTLSKEAFAEAVRGHWGVESMHWILDVTMKEDDCQIYLKNGAENFGILRRLRLNMLKSEPSKVSMVTKRKRAWMKTTFLEAILKATFTKKE